MRQVIFTADCRMPTPTLASMVGRRPPACWVAPHRPSDWWDLRWDTWGPIGRPLDWAVLANTWPGSEPDDD